MYINRNIYPLCICIYNKLRDWYPITTTTDKNTISRLQQSTIIDQNISQSASLILALCTTGRDILFVQQQLNMSIDITNKKFFHFHYDAALFKSAWQIVFWTLIWFSFTIQSPDSLLCVRLCRGEDFRHLSDLRPCGPCFSHCISPAASEQPAGTGDASELGQSPLLSVSLPLPRTAISA